MQLGHDQFEPAHGVPKTFRFCKVCRKETPHEILANEGVVAYICIPCLEEDLLYELDRD